MNNRVESEQEKLFRQAREESWLELRLEEKKKIAWNLMRKNTPMSLIKELSGLSDGVILSLVKEFQNDHR